MRADILPGKVIMGLECCTNHDMSMCLDKCPYHTDGCSGGVKMMRDALSLLKAVAPRVLMLEELQTAEECMEPVFVEMLDEKGKPGDTPDLFSWRFVRHITPATDGKIYMLMNYGFNSALWTETYNVTWRCWDTRPTDEQRKAEKWNEQ